MTTNPTIRDIENRIGELERWAAELIGEGLVSLRGGCIGLGYAFGMALAITLSWSRNASILWCILHGALSWGYVIYFAVTR